MNPHRRSFLRGALATAGAVSSARVASAQARRGSATRPPAPIPPGGYGAGVVPVETPDLSKMPWTVDNGVKIFNISAELVRTQFLPGRVVDTWGFNGSMPGPTVEMNEGDRVRFNK